MFLDQSMVAMCMNQDFLLLAGMLVRETETTEKPKNTRTCQGE